MLANNSSENDGGGLFAYIGSNPILKNVTIVNNLSGNGSGGIYNFNTIDMIIKNSIISGNSSTQIGISSQPQIQNLTVLYSLIEGGQNAINDGANVINWGSGNTDLDPQFVDPANGDYRLSDYSPAIGAGTSEDATKTDIDGNPRPGPADSNPDMGVYEHSLGSPKPPKPGTVLWLFEMGEKLPEPNHGIILGSEGSARGDATPALGHNGILYFGSLDGKVYALDGVTGVKIWEYDTSYLIESSPAIGRDGTVYIGRYGRFLALNGTTGEKMWDNVELQTVISSPAIDELGNLYVGDQAGKVHSLDGKTGVRNWTSEKIASDPILSPAIGIDGTIYVSEIGGSVIALAAKTGVELWRFRPENRMQSSPSIGSDGTVYFGSWDEKIYALNGKAGIKKWEYKTGSVTEIGQQVNSSPSIGIDGNHLH